MNMPQLRNVLFGLGLLVVSGCTSYIPLTGKLMKERNLAPDELGVVQLYVNKEVRFERKVKDQKGGTADGRLADSLRITEVVELEQYTPGVQLGCAVLYRDPTRKPADDVGTQSCAGQGPPDEQRGVRLWVTFERGTRLPFIGYGDGSFVLDTPGGIARLNEYDYKVRFEGTTPPILVIEDGAPIRRVIRRRMDGERLGDIQPDDK